jgi:hypothetical protein
MFWSFRRRNQKGSKGRVPRRRPTARPALLELEPRIVPLANLIEHGGPVLANVQVEVVFYGSAW